MKKIILIKLGGSIITDKSKPYTARPKVIRNLARQIKLAWNKGYRFLISHGSGSFGHTSAKKYQTAEGLALSKAEGLENKESIYGLAIVQQDAIEINRIVNKIFLEEGLPVLSFIPSSFTVSQNKKLAKIFVGPIIQALRIEALPLVFGDVILDKKLGCCIYSGETTLDNLIKPLKKAGFTILRVIQCGSTEGVYDSQGKTIPKITPVSFPKFKKMIGVSASSDVTGGMIHKIEESLKMAKQGIDSQIIDGQKEGNLLKAIYGDSQLGTKITL